MYVYIYSSVLYISDIFARSKFVQIHFSSSASQVVWVALKNMARVAVAYTSSNSRHTLLSNYPNFTGAYLLDMRTPNIASVNSK